MQNPKFCEIVGTKYYEPKGWKNKNKMLTRYEGCIGVKTGYTKEAGRCLVTAAMKNGRDNGIIPLPFKTPPTTTAPRAFATFIIEKTEKWFATS
jgi:D-alanyl-D-alanine carboxypeptidase